MIFKRILFVFLVVVFLTSIALADNESLFFYGFDVGLKLLQIEQKTAMVVIDSEHCVFCKKLKDITFKDKEVISILNNYYFPIELSLDKNEEIHYKQYKLTPQSFAAGLKIRGTPTMVFFDEKADVLTLLPGYLPPERMVPVLKYIGQRIYEKNIKFGDYLKKPVEGTYRGSEEVINLSLEDLKFVEKNDPFVKIFAFSSFQDEDVKNIVNMEVKDFEEKLSDLPKDKRYILIGKNSEELKKLGENMLSMGFPTVLIYNISSNKQ